MSVPDDIQIVYIPPDAVNNAGTDITTSVTYADAYFESQAAAVPGSFHLTVKDPNHVHEFVSGGRIEVTLGGRKIFGGFVTVPTRDFFLPADDTSKPIKTRRWSLDGIDYNLLLDKRVLRNPADYTHAIPDVPLGSSTDTHIISLFDDYFDLGFSGGGTIDISSMVVHANDFTVKWTWPTQGETMRSVLDALVIFCTTNGDAACIYWIDADARINWLALHTTAAPWGFSDVPGTWKVNADGEPDPGGTEVTFIGWRDGSASEDGGSVINDVFVWGGSPLGSSGTVVLAHRDNDGSVAAHGRWQMAELHPGETGYKTQTSVNSRANALISGVTSGTAAVTGAQGLVNPDQQYTLTWFGHDVPLVGNVRQHLIPGDVTTFHLWSFSSDGGVTPFTVNLPMRQMRITFPTLPSDNPNGTPLTYVQLQGTFGLQMTDPVWWWDFLRKMRPMPQPAPVVTTDNNSGSFPYGSYFQGAPQEAANGSRTVFTLIAPYIAGTLEVFVSGLLATKGTDYTETDPDTGTFTFASPPADSVPIVCYCQTG